jgi:repressor LexA
VKHKRKPGWKSGGGIGGQEIATAERDQLGRVAITNQQRRVIDAIDAAITENGYPPTMRELSDKFGWSGPSAALCHIRLLERKGWILRSPSQARAMKVVK